ITDFGIVKVLGEQTEFAMTQSGFQPGTVEYMSPEQLLGNEVDKRADLYSLGVTFYEMLTGRLPFLRSATGSDWEIRKGHIELDPPPIVELRPEIHPQLAAIVMRSMRKKPNDRYQSAANFLEAVLDYERNYRDQALSSRNPPRGMEGRITQPQAAPSTLKAAKFTMMDEAATLIARPRTESAPPYKSQLVDEDAPTKLQESSPAPTLPYKQATASPDPGGTEITGLATTQPVQPAQSSQSGRRWPMAAGAVGLLLAGTAAGAMLFSRGASPESSPRTGATKVETPTATPAHGASPTAHAVKPKPAPPVEKTNFKQAQSLEQQERYQDAIKVYEDYLARNPNTPDAGIVTSYRDGLARMQEALAAADSAMNARMYPLAIKHYQRALTLRPDSQRARAGLEDAAAKIKSSLPPRMRREGPFDQNELQRGGARPGRQDPLDQDSPSKIFRRPPRPTPTPRD
ncbi:MAG: tetratricopeptide repeat protein, partial [Blastocatellia bacterium]|nr:tetratricopeptide repeat protein [Blastocatellia bacterium]